MESNETKKRQQRIFGTYTKVVVETEEKSL